MNTQPEAAKHRRFYRINSALGYVFFILTALALALERAFHMVPGELAWGFATTAIISFFHASLQHAKYLSLAK